MFCGLLLSGALVAHEGGHKDLQPTKADRDLKLARQKLKAAKKKIAAQGGYRCCVKPSCDLCARTTGTCDCASNVAKGLGACGECYAAWGAGRGVVKGVDRKSVKLLSAAKQAAPIHCDMPAEYGDAAAALDRAKRTLAAEGRFSCCIRGGCGQCAQEANCPCGRDLARGRNGVCGDCLDGWRSGNGSFIGVPLSDVELAPPEPSEASMGPAGGDAGGWYASGTSQVPKAAPMDMLHARIGGWTLSFQGVLFAIYSAETGPRREDKTFAANWVMTTLSHRLGPGAFTFRSMLSLEPATITDRQYPLLFQEGETAYGVPIVDGQHPHDFFMELAVAYQIRLGERTAVNFYGGPRGEPALGPPAYPHRLSASEDPIAPISHHMQDASHVTSNVATAGITYGPVTWEVSGFHGREPGEHRWQLDKGGIDSLSSRLTVTPTSRWSAQYSLGRIEGREATHPLRPTRRDTASVMYVRPVGSGHWATSAIWGRNHDLAYTQTPNIPVFPLQPLSVSAIRPMHIVTVPTRIPGQIYNSYLLESTLLLKRRNWIWGRVENVDRDSLLLYEQTPLLILVDEQRLSRVQAYTAGYERDLPSPAGWLSTALGGQMTAFSAHAGLASVYGVHPLGMQVWLRLRIAHSAGR